MGWASRGNRAEQKRLSQRLHALSVRVKLGALTTDDIQFLNRCGPNVRTYVGYTPLVACYAPKVTLT